MANENTAQTAGTDAGTVTHQSDAAAPVTGDGGTGKRGRTTARRNVAHLADTAGKRDPNAPRYEVKRGQFCIVTLPDCRIVIDSLTDNPTAPAQKLAEARIEWTAGLLKGNALQGFGFWFGEKNGTQVYTSVPERTYGAGKRYAMLRNVGEGDGPKPVDGGPNGALKGFITDACIRMFGGPDGMRQTIALVKGLRANPAAVAAGKNKADGPKVRPGTVSL